jgi:protein involved in polysaccharide export with SLBB domain
MKQIVFLMLLFLGSSATAFGQGMSDAQVLQYAMSQKKAGMSEADIASGLLQQGATMAQIERIRGQYAQQITKRGLDDTVDNAVGSVTARMRTNNEPNDNAIVTHEGDNAPVHVPEALTPSGKRVFGRDIFNHRALTFEPQMNIATPQDYVLGPGDQLIIDVYGDTQKSEKLTVSPDGNVTVPGYGPIYVAGLSVTAAQSSISKKLGTYYASSEIKLSVGQTRTILVNVMGEVRTPGTYTVSAFATVFHALYMAGGVSRLGTLRNIKVIRHGRQVSSVDVYEFILNGRLAGNVRLQDNDVIQVGPYESIVEIEGRVKRPMAYELRKNESLATLLKYSGGFANDAYKKSLRVLRNNGRMKSVFNVEEFEFPEFKMVDGDVVSVDTIINRYENMVEVKGAVFRPGLYNLGSKVHSVRSLIENADGLTEEAMASRAVLRRMKANRTQEVISINLKGILDGTAADVPLENEDILFIPTLAEHQNLRTLTITGEVIFPGTYEYADNMTVQDFILQAGGLTDRASNVKVDVSRRLRDPNATGAGMEIAKTYSLTLNDQTNFTLEPYDIVQIRRSPVFQDPIRVRVEGEIAFEGAYTMDMKNQRLSDVVKAAGGVLPGAYVRGARLVRTMSDDERARLHEAIILAKQTAASSSQDSLSLAMMGTQTTYLVGIHLDEALANPGCDEDIELQDGDRLVIPRFNHTVKVSGDILKPNTVAFKDGKNYKYYVEQGGGYGKRARKRHTYVLYQNGTIAKASKAKIEPGCEVIVPTKGPANSLALQQWLSVSTSFASLATMFVSIANLIKK